MFGLTTKPQEKIGTANLHFTGNASKEEFIKTTDPITWYHTFTFDNGYTVKGYWDVAPTAPAIEFPELKEKTILDIGAASGWFSFYFEQQGASVTALEIQNKHQFNRHGVNEHSDKYEPTWNTKSFTTMHKLLGSNVTYTSGSVYDLGKTVLQDQSFDYVFIGCLLLHLRDPIGALKAARSICTDTVIATTPIWHDSPVEEPAMKAVLPKPNSISWWYPNLTGYKHWFTSAGYSSVNVDRSVTQETDIPRPNQAQKEPTSNPIELQIAHAKV